MYAPAERCLGLFESEECRSLTTENIPAPSIEHALESLESLRKAIDRAAPRYANGDHFHYKRVAGHVQALKNKILSSAREFDSGKQPAVTIRFVVDALAVASRMPEFNQSADNKGRALAIKGLLTLLLRNLKASRASLPAELKAAVRECLGSADGTDAKVEALIAQCEPLCA